MLFNALGFVVSKPVSRFIPKHLTDLSLLVLYVLLLMIVFIGFSCCAFGFSYVVVLINLFSYGLVVALLAPQVGAISYYQLQDRQISKGVCLLSCFGPLSASLCVSISA